MMHSTHFWCHINTPVTHWLTLDQLGMRDVYHWAMLWKYYTVDKTVPDESFISVVVIYSGGYMGMTPLQLPIWQTLPQKNMQAAGCEEMAHYWLYKLWLWEEKKKSLTNPQLSTLRILKHFFKQTTHPPTTPPPLP